MNTVKSLKELYVSLGGNIEDLKGLQTDAQVIKCLSLIIGSTIELPAVSGSDNGKVLKVIEGAWGKGTDEALPEVTSDDNGKVLTVDDGAWTPAELPSNGYEIKKKSFTGLSNTYSGVDLTNKGLDDTIIVGAVLTSKPSDISAGDKIMHCVNYTFNSNGKKIPFITFYKIIGMSSGPQFNNITASTFDVDVYYIEPTA